MRFALAILGFIIGFVCMFAFEASAANDTKWRTQSGATGSGCNTVGRNSRCFFSFDSAGQTPAISKGCDIWSFRVEGTSPLVHPYVCYDSTFANCTRMNGTNRATGAFGQVVLDASNPQAEQVPFNTLIFDLISGSGHVIAECGG